MTPDYLPICTSGKKPYPTQEAAERSLERIRRNRRDNPDHASIRRGSAPEQATYECVVCHCWHLASITKKMRRAAYAYKNNRRGGRS